MTVTFVPKTGTFTATREELLEMDKQEHRWKIEGLAKYVLSKPSKQARRKFLDEFQQRHGEEITYELMDEILKLAAQTRKP